MTESWHGLKIKEGWTDLGDGGTAFIEGWGGTR